MKCHKDHEDLTNNNKKKILKGIRSSYRYL